MDLDMFHNEESISTSRRSFESDAHEPDEERAHAEKQIVALDTSGHEVDISGLSDDENNDSVNVADVGEEACDSFDEMGRSSQSVNNSCIQRDLPLSECKQSRGCSSKRRRLDEDFLYN